MFEVDLSLLELYMCAFHDFSFVSFGSTWILFKVYSPVPLISGFLHILHGDNHPTVKISLSEMGDFA